MPLGGARQAEQSILQEVTRAKELLKFLFIFPHFSFDTAEEVGNFAWRLIHVEYICSTQL